MALLDFRLLVGKNKTFDNVMCFCYLVTFYVWNIFASLQFRSCSWNDKQTMVLQLYCCKYILSIQGDYILINFSTFTLRIKNLIKMPCSKAAVSRTTKVYFCLWKWETLQNTCSGGSVCAGGNAVLIQLSPCQYSATKHFTFFAKHVNSYSKQDTVLALPPPGFTIYVHKNLKSFTPTCIEPMGNLQHTDNTPPPTTILLSGITWMLG